jgi:hypothetical protein
MFLVCSWSQCLAELVDYVLYAILLSKKYTAPVGNIYLEGNELT